MTDPAASGTPPEVPDEFAAAYWAAYEAALEAQSVPVTGGGHAERVVSNSLDHQVELPRRTRAIRIGTHRSTRKSRPFETVAGATSSGTGDTGSSTSSGAHLLFSPAEEASVSSGSRMTESAWFVPVLLVGLALLLVLGAYVLGREFAQSVGADAGPAVQPGVVAVLGPRAVP